MTKSKKPGNQRKALFNAPLHRKRKMVASHLSDELIKRYNVRSLPVVKGDTVRVMRGDEHIRDKEAEVVKVDSKSMTVSLEGINVAKADASEVARPIHPSNLQIVKLNLTDNKRKNKLEQLSGGEVIE